MSQELVNSIIINSQESLNNLQQIKQSPEYLALSPEEKKAFTLLDIEQAQKFIKSNSVRSKNTQNLALALDT